MICMNIYLYIPHHMYSMCVCAVYMCVWYTHKCIYQSDTEEIHKTMLEANTEGWVGVNYSKKEANVF